MTEQGKQNQSQQQPESQEPQKQQQQAPEPTAREMVAEAMKIARGEKEPSKQPEPEQKPQLQEPKEKKEEEPKKDEDVQREIQKIKLQYQTLLEEERRQKAGIYKDLKKTREKLQQIQTQPRSQTQPKDVNELIKNATSALKEAGFTDEQISELQEKALDDPFAVATAISYAIASQKPAKEPEKPAYQEPQQPPVDTNEVMLSWKKEVLELMDKHPDLWKKNERGELVPNEGSPKFKIYDEEAQKLLLEDPSLQYSPHLPRLVALRMEQRLLEEKIAESKKEAFEEGRKAEAERQARVEEGFVASSGVRPEAKESIQLTPDEEAQARRDVERGLFKSVEEWAKYYKTRQFRY